MYIFETVKDRNQNNLDKQVMSIKTDAGERRTYTYRQMFEQVDVYKKKLIDAGIIKGDRIIIVAENSPEWNIAYLTTMACLCTAVLIDASLTVSEIVRLIEVSDARCIFSSPMVMEKLIEDDYKNKDIPVLNILDTATAFGGYLSKIAQHILPTVDRDVDAAFIIYSSGTTKTATGIVHTHDAMIGTTNAAIEFNSLNETDKMLVVIPNSHIYGVVTSMLGPLMLGGSMHFIESMTGENVISAFKEYQPTIFSCVPRVFEMFHKQIVDKINSKKVTAIMFKMFFPICLKLRKNSGFNLGAKLFKSVHEGFGGHMRIFCAAGAPLNPQATEFYFGVGLNLFLNYGLTETNVPVIANSYDNYTLTTCGKAYPHVDIKLVPIDDSNNCEIYLKTPFMMKGYFRDEQATQDAFEDGYFKTGDIGVLDAQGNFSVVGRCKDNIVLSTGKKVTPDDIEQGYMHVSGVKELVVCGVPASEAGYDEVHAFIVKDPVSNLTDEEIEKSVYGLGSTLSQYMRINKIHFVQEIPKTSLQKPKRFLLKKSISVDAKPIQTSTQIVKEKLDMQQIIIELISRVHKSDIVIHQNTRLFEDIGLDSLSSIELDVLIEEHLGKTVSYAFKPEVTVGQLTHAVKYAKTATNTNSLFNKKFPVEKKKFDYFVFKFYAGLARWVYKVEIKGIENLPKNNGYIICPNHQTNFDFLWVTLNFGKAQFQNLGCMAKKELFTNSPVSKLLSRVCGMIPIDRDNHNSQAMALCKQKLKEGWNFLIYPEGTRTKTGEIGEFKKGAAMISIDENVPIVPVKIKGGFDIFPAGRRLPKLFDFKHMRRLRIEIDFSTPITPSGMDVDSYNQKLRDIVVKL